MTGGDGRGRGRGREGGGSEDAVEVGLGAGGASSGMEGSPDGGGRAEFLTRFHLASYSGPLQQNPLCIPIATWGATPLFSWGTQAWRGHGLARVLPEALGTRGLCPSCRLPGGPTTLRPSDPTGSVNWPLRAHRGLGLERPGLHDGGRALCHTRGGCWAGALGPTTALLLPRKAQEPTTCLLLLGAVGVGAEQTPGPHWR